MVNGKVKIKNPTGLHLRPAGLFCGYALALHGYRPVILEQGDPASVRRKKVEMFWKNGVSVCLISCLSGFHHAVCHIVCILLLSAAAGCTDKHHENQERRNFPQPFHCYLLFAV